MLENIHRVALRGGKMAVPQRRSSRQACSEQGAWEHTQRVALRGGGNGGATKKKQQAGEPQAGVCLAAAKCIDHKLMHLCLWGFTWRQRLTQSLTARRGAPVSTWCRPRAPCASPRAARERCASCRTPRTCRCARGSVATVGVRRWGLSRGPARPRGTRVVCLSGHKIIFVDR